MTSKAAIGYRDALFDGAPSLDWLRPGWRGLRLYGRRARQAIEAGDILHKAEMIGRADRLLVFMSGILDTEETTTLGPALMSVYGALQNALLRANVNDDTSALDEFDKALAVLAKDMLNEPESTIAA